MLGIPTLDRRTVRHAATRAEIVAAAWHLTRERGLAGLTLRDLARSVGMQAPSLYEYFPAKDAIYDAMFADGNRQLLACLDQIDWSSDPCHALKQGGHAFLRFCVKDPVRSQLLFQRTLPGFEPSPDAYATAIQVVEVGRARLLACGATDPAHFDLWTALVSGLANQQLANDPGGERWTRLADDAFDMFLDHVLKRVSAARRRRRT